MEEELICENCGNDLVCEGYRLCSECLERSGDEPLASAIRELAAAIREHTALVREERLSYMQILPESQD